MSLVTLNSDLSKIPFVHFTPKIKCTLTGSHLRMVTDTDDADADNAGRHSTPVGRHRQLPFIQHNNVSQF